MTGSVERGVLWFDPALFPDLLTLTVCPPRSRVCR